MHLFLTWWCYSGVCVALGGGAWLGLRARGRPLKVRLGTDSGWIPATCCLPQRVIAPHAVITATPSAGSQDKPPLPADDPITAVRKVTTNM